MKRKSSGLNSRYGLPAGGSSPPFGMGGPASGAGVELATQSAQRYSPLQSLISTNPPLSGSQSRAISQPIQTFRGGGTSGDASRDAFARSMADASSNQMAGAMDRYRQQFQQKAEVARSADLVTQGQLANSAYQTERERQQVSRQQDQKQRQTLAEISQYKRLARADAAANRRNALIQGVIGTGLIAATAPILGPALAGGALFGGGAAAAGAGAAGAAPILGQATVGSGLLGGLMGSMAAGRYGSGGRR